MSLAHYGGVAVSHVAERVVTEPYAEIFLYLAGTGTPGVNDGTALSETIYATPDGLTTHPNPFHADVDGNFDFYLATAKAVKLAATGPLIGTLVKDYEQVLNVPGEGNNLTLDGTFYVKNANTQGGIAIDQNGRIRIGVEALAWNGAPFLPNVLVGTTYHDEYSPQGRLNQVMVDFLHYTNNPGLTTLNTPTPVLAAGTATGGGANYLDDTHLALTPNALAGYTLHILSGQGATQIRRIASNTPTRIVIDQNWPTIAPNNTSVYEVRVPGDDGGGRFVMTCLPEHNANSRALEIHIARQVGSPHLGIVGTESSTGVGEDIPDPIYARGFDMGAHNAWTGTAMKKSGIAFRVWGPAGWYEAFRFEDASGITVYKVSEGGSVYAKGSIVAVASLTAGQSSAGTNPLTVKQSSDTFGGGPRFVRSASGQTYGESHIGTDDARYDWVVNPSTGKVVDLRMDPSGTGPAFQVYNVLGGSGNLLELVDRNVAVRFSVSVAGAIVASSGATLGGPVIISGQQVLTGRQTAVADVTGTIPAGGTGTAAGAFDTAGNRDTFIATVTEIKTQFNAWMNRARIHGFV